MTFSRMSKIDKIPCLPFPSAFLSLKCLCEWRAPDYGITWYGGRERNQIHKASLDHCRSLRHCLWSLVAVNVYCHLVSPWACFSLVMLPGCLYLISALISISDSSGSLLWLLSGLGHKQSSLYCGVLPPLVICHLPWESAISEISL